jgi:iron complex outermembrane recepter protein
MRLTPISAAIHAAVMRTLPALSVLAPVTLAGTPVLAQELEARPLGSAIPAQPLAGALADLARQTGLQLVYVSGVVTDQTAPAIPAGLGTSDALTRMLQNSGLRFRYLNRRTILILAAPPSDSGRAAGPTAAIPSEVVITAARTVQDTQGEPMTIEAFGGQQLSQLSTTNLNEFLKFTPNVTFSGNGPATGNIFIRGLGAVGSGNQAQATSAPFPTVALYLDDQSMQFPSRNNDVYVVDMERIDVVEGPQGTFLGGGAQAGAIRYVTQKPKLDFTGGEVDASYGVTAGGAANTSINATFNVPLLDARLAARVVVFSEHQGGYIDNVASTISYVPGSVEASTGAHANNAPLLAANTNSVDYQGARASLLWQVNDSWNFLLQQNYQDVSASGYFYAYPFDSNGIALRPYQIAAFNPAFTKDDFESTAWTLGGESEAIRAVYAGSFMIRHIEGQQDYSNYLRSATGGYYACIGPGAAYFNDRVFPGPPPEGLTGTPLRCYPPVGFWHDAVENQHQSHELRITTNSQSRLRWLLGAYWEKFVIFDQMNFNYLTIPQCDPNNLRTAEAGGPACLSAVGPKAGAFANDPRLRENMNNAFGFDDQRGYKQLALFGSADLDLVPKVLSAGVGARRYRYDDFETGSQWGSATYQSILNRANGSCTECGFPMNHAKREVGSTMNANLSWHIGSQTMTYYAFSQGRRPGGFNRVTSTPDVTPYAGTTALYCGTSSTDARCLPGGSLYGLRTAQYVRPTGYGADTLTNNEIGVKSRIFEERVLLNMSAYLMHWSDIQQTLFDPQNLGNTSFVAQGASYSIKGVEVQLVTRPTEGLTLQGTGSWNRSNQTETPCLESVGVTTATPNNPTPAGQCITIVKGVPYTNPWGVTGSSLPYSPAQQFSFLVRYDWNRPTIKPFALLHVSHIGAMRNAPENYPDGNDSAQNPPTTTLLKYTIPACTTYDAALGMLHGNWSAEIEGTNITNAYGPSNISSAQFIKATVPLRPRVILMRFGFSY